MHPVVFVGILRIGIDPAQGMLADDEQISLMSAIDDAVDRNDALTGQHIDQLYVSVNPRTCRILRAVLPRECLQRKITGLDKAAQRIAAHVQPLAEI